MAGLEIFKSPDYKLFQDAIDSEIQRLTRKCVGVLTKQPEPITPHDEEIMWEKGVLGDQDPKTLLHTLVFLFGKFFALRSGEEHRSLTFEQLSVIQGDHIERTRLQYRSHGEKNHGGGLKQRNVTPKVVEQHENVDKPERCVVRLYKKYISKFPKDFKKDEVFYLTPKKDVKLESNTWYTKIPFGNLCKEAEIGGYKTNHSLKCYYDEKMFSWFSVYSDFIFGKNAPCQLLRLNFKNKSDFLNYDFSFKLSAITRFCSSRVALRELDRERRCSTGFCAFRTRFCCFAYQISWVHSLKN